MVKIHKMQKQKRNKITKEQAAENKKRKNFKSSIEEVFVFSGFQSIPVQGFQFQLGDRCNELDHCFIYENIIIICEDTIRTIQKEEKTNSKWDESAQFHKLKKNESAEAIIKEKEKFIQILKKKYPHVDALDKYSYTRFKIYYLYFEYGVQRINIQDRQRYKKLIFINEPTLKYMHTMAKCIKASFKYELFRFLKLKKSDIGKANCEKDIKSIASTIIYPDSVTGIADGVRMVSFMMKPEDLIENGFVLRKDGWETDVELYQRLIIPKKIRDARNSVAGKKTTFINNIIVSLPDNVEFYAVSEGKRSQVDIKNIVNYESNIEICIPTEFNSIAIIDGQHRVYSFYQDNVDNDIEKIVRSLRNELNLLVTGIIYPKDSIYNDELERRKFESQLFVSINQNATTVDADTLIQVQAIMNPTSGEAISRRVIECLNNDEPFKNLFQLSKVKDGQIKTASIIQYALSSLLVAKNNENTLYHYWLIRNKKDPNFELKTSEDIKDYVNYCTNCLKIYFKAIKSRFLSYWNKDSKLLKVISLNAFIIAFRDTLKKTGGPRDYDFYLKVFQGWDFSFEDSKEKNEPFPYAGAQYGKFARNVIIPRFDNNS